MVGARRGIAQPAAPGVSALDEVAFLFEELAQTFAQVALQLDGIVGDRASCATRPLQLGAQAFQERRVVWQIVNDGHGLAAAPALFDAQFRHDSARNRLGGLAFDAALAIALGPSASGTNAADAGRVNEPPLSVIAHGCNQ